MFIKKYKSIYKFTFCFLLALLVMSTLFCALSLLNVSKKASAAEIIDQQLLADVEAINGKYFDNDKILSLPKTALISVNEQEIVSLNGIVTYPSGIVYQTGTDFILNEKGKYVIEYFYDFEGEKKTVSKEFTIIDSNWSFSTYNEEVASSAVFTKLTIPSGDKYGLRVNLVDGDTFKYNVPINVYDAKWNGLVDIINFYPDIKQEKYGTPNMLYTSVKLVDCYDANNFLEFVIWASTDPLSPAFYVVAGSANQDLSGLEEWPFSTNDTINIDSKNYKVHHHDRYAGKYGLPLAESNEWFTSFGGAHFQWNTENNITTSTNLLGEKIITDIDDTDIINGEPFEGFTNGDVYVEIACYGYTGNSVIIEIESLLGVSQDNLIRESYVDTSAPVIKIDVENTDESGVYASINNEFEIPKATVTDANFFGDLDVSVCYNYGSSNLSNVSVLGNKFIPTSVGKYTIIYKATDIYGNQATKTLNINVLDSKGISYTDKRLQTLKVGEENVLPDIEAKGINKNLVCKIFLTDPTGNVTEITDQTIIPNEVGKYTIKYKLYDNVYDETFVYDVYSMAEGIIDLDDIPLPPYYIKNETYQIEPYYFYTHNGSEWQKLSTKAFVKVDDGQYEQVTNLSSYTVKGNKSIQIKYVYGENEKIKESEVVSIIDLNFGSSNVDYTGYFQGDFNAIEKSDSYLYQANSINSNAETLTFANVISSNNFSLEFKIPENYDNFTAVNFKLTNFYNRKEFVSIRYEKMSDSSVLYYVNGEYCGKTGVQFSGEYMHTLNYNSSSKTLTNEASNSKVIDMFETDLCVLTISLENMTGESAIQIYKLNNQYLMPSASMFLANYQAYVKLDSTTLDLDTEFSLYPCAISSVFGVALKESLTVSVFKPDGSLLLDKVDANQIHCFKINTMGNWRIEYNYELMGTRRVDNSIINVSILDNVKPTISFENGLNENKAIVIEKNTKFNLKKFTVSDNITLAEDLITNVLICDANQLVIQHNVSEYTFTEAGRYMIKVICLDGSGNMSSSYYWVYVE